MKEVNKLNIAEFMQYYHNFHDSVITRVNYNVSESKVIMNIDVFWSGEAKISDNNKYDTNRVKMIIVFKGVEKIQIKEMYSWDYIRTAYLKYTILDSSEYICFATDETNPLLYIVCESMEYEEV